MVIAKICVDGVTAVASGLSKIPKGIIGATIEVTFGSSWDGLSKTAVIRGAVTKDVLDVGNVFEIPAECVAMTGYNLKVGFYGTAGDTVAIPTIWADLGMVTDAADPSGDTSTDPALPVWAQIWAELEKISQNGGNVSKEDVERLVDAYLAENPPQGKPGMDGFSPTAKVEQTDNGARITVTDKTGTTSATVTNGKAGYTPVKGVDYFTAADKAEMVEEVTEEMTNGLTLTDQTTGTKYRVYANNGKLTMEEA